MTRSLPDPCPASNVRPLTPPTEHRLACALTRETRAELLLFVARMPQFRAEIDATPEDVNGWKDGEDIGQVEYDLVGLADLLALAVEHLPHGGATIRVYHPVAAPAAYCDALALIVARVEALRGRLESHLDNGDEPACDTAGERRADGTERAWLRTAAWAAWQAASGNVGSVRHDRKEVAEATLADALVEALTDEAAEGQTRPEPRTSEDEAGEALTLSRVLSRLADAVAAGPALLLGERPAAALSGVGGEDVSPAGGGRGVTKRTRTKRAKAEATEAT